MPVEVHISVLSELIFESGPDRLDLVSFIRHKLIEYRVVLGMTATGDDNFSSLKVSRKTRLQISRCELNECFFTPLMAVLSLH